MLVRVWTILNFEYWSLKVSQIVEHEKKGSSVFLFAAMTNEHMQEEWQPSFWCYQLENFPALRSSQSFGLSKVSGSKIIEIMKSWSRILKQGSRSLAKSWIYYFIPALTLTVCSDVSRFQNTCYTRHTSHSQCCKKKKTTRRKNFLV